MAFNHSSEYLVVGSDTETVHVFRCSTTKAGPHTARSWGISGPSSPSTESVEDDMDRVIEQKRRNGSMGSLFSPDLTDRTDKS